MTKKFSGLFFVLVLASLQFSAVWGQATQQSSEPDLARKQIIPEGTEIQMSLRDPVSSKLSEPGDQVIATVRRDVVLDGYKLLKEGTEVIGRVTLAEPARRPLKGGRLHITFDRIRLDGQEQKLSAIIKSASDFTRDEKVKSDSEGTLQGGKDGGKVLRNVGTATALGMSGVTIAILAGAAGDNGIGTGTVVTGASILGGSAVAGVVMTKGKDIRLDERTIIRLKLERPLAVE